MCPFINSCGYSLRHCDVCDMYNTDERYKSCHFYKTAQKEYMDLIKRQQKLYKKK